MTRSVVQYPERFSLILLDARLLWSADLILTLVAAVMTAGDLWMGVFTQVNIPVSNYRTALLVL